jgi:predicted dehydrogenase
MRNFSNTQGCSVVKIADARPERRAAASNLYPSVTAVETADEILNDSDIDAVIIATPVFTHFELAKRALVAGKHVLLEKPMTSTVSEAKELIDIARQKDRVLMVDHTFLYTGAVQKMKALVKDGALGNLRYFDSTRINLGLIQQDVNVLWDLAPHDISILNYLTGKKARSVQATGISHIHNGIENIAYLTVNYEDDFIAHFNCSWSSPVKIRMMLVGGDKKMIVFNDMEPTEKIKVYDTGHEIKTDDEKRKVLIDYRVGDVHIPMVQVTEALAHMAADFINAIQNGTQPISDFNSGLQTIEILEASQTSIKQQGREIIIEH